MIETKWVGEFFTPVVGERYTIPLTAANYPDLRGKTGMCVRVFQSAFGHAWAWLEIDSEVVPVRTCYLHQSVEDGETPKLVEEFAAMAGHTPLEQMARAWQGPSNSGTAKLTGPSSV
jgi:hypothetical protein